MCPVAEEFYIDLFKAMVWIMKSSLSTKRDYISVLQPQEKQKRGNGEGEGRSGEQKAQVNCFITVQNF